ncbi:MAG: helix-turn-helix domain-containing protein [Thermoanaerobaculaceae bacterium]
MGTGRTMKTYFTPEAPLSVPPGLRVTRARPRAFAEWQALRRWRKLPAWEQDVAGYLLRQAREGAGLTQRELAARLGVTQQAIAQAERWDANPCLDLLRRWAAATGSVLVLSFEVRCLVRHA